jgi:splicing factor 3B subunit 3
MVWHGYSVAVSSFSQRSSPFDPCDVQSFASDQCPEGFVGVVKSSLRIMAVDSIGETFNQAVSRLRYTPRRLLVHPEQRLLVVAEADYQALSLEDNPALRERLVDDEGAPLAGPEFSPEVAAELDQWGAPMGVPGQWAACLRIVDPTGAWCPGMVAKKGCSDGGADRGCAIMSQRVC